MTLNHSPSIVTSGLQFYLDAANSKSYPGSGTTCTDLSGNQKNATLTNGPTFSSLNNGYFSLDGINDYITSTNALRIGGSNTNVTVEVAFFLPTGGGGYLITNERESVSMGHGWYYCTSSSLYFSQHSRTDLVYEYNIPASATGLANLRDNNWNIVSWSLSIGTTSMNCRYLINGYTETITNNSLIFFGTESSTDDNIDIGRRRNFTYSTDPARFYIGNVKIYNRQLSVAEQTQNFNALRGRYSI